MQQIDSQARLKSLLRELFQLDVADLDFGLYRLFQLKRDEVEAFLNKQLPAEVDRAFETAAGAEREQLQERLDELAMSARDTIADDVILPSGEPNPKYAEIKAVREYLEARKRLEAVETSEAQRAEVFNLLYAFFSRYYDAGDFIPRRFYGARASYAVPYSGEEVLFHWANKGQHYVKTGETFQDYAFTVSTVDGEYRVRFRLSEATTPKDNTKGETRFFFPLPKEATFDKAGRTFTVPFEYRLPAEAEVAKYGKNAKAQEAILDEAAPKILKAVPDVLLHAALSASSPSGTEAEGDQPPTLLRRRLTHFTKKNTTDYFVHKNLGTFLRQEVEFFVRDQVVHEADLEGDFDAKRRTIRIFRKLAETLITFLAQIEDAQKRLFEKKKFVLRTDYLVPIQNVPRTLWPEVLASKAQLAEWKDLFALSPKSDLFNFKGQVNEHVLQGHPTLVVDTRHYGKEFKDRLMASWDDVDGQTDGVVIQSENFQALGLLESCLRQQLKCIYIDPPYNTDAGPIVYKNGYRSSSWISLLDSRLMKAKSLLTDTGILCVTIDDYQVHELGELLYTHFERSCQLGVAVIRNNPSGRSTVTGLSVCHEYAFFYGSTAGATLRRLPRTEKQLRRFTTENGATVDWRNFRKDGGAVTHRALRPKQFYPIYVRAKGKQLRIPDMSWNRDKRAWDVLEETKEGEIALWPIDDKGKERVWSLNHLSAREKSADLEVRVSRDGQPQILRRHWPSEGVLPRSWWDKKTYAAREYGSAALRDLFGQSSVFSFAKSPFAVQDCIWISGLADELGTVLDFFAGSGTTAHAVINLNRETGGNRKFILVEIGDYFDTVLVPRIKKVMFAPEWKGGKPKRLATEVEAERTPRLVKVLRLESYEDALHNTFSDKTIERLAERESAHREAVGEEEYRIRYLVKLPLEASDSMLNLARLEHPFDYTLEVLTDNGPKTETVDLVETFNWVYGLRVHRLLTWVNEKDKSGKEEAGRSYRAVVGSDRQNKRQVLVVWRDTTALDAKVERPFLEARAKELGTFEEQWINGDTAAKGFASLDGLFKRLMEKGER